jgi:phosphate transport system protein
MLKELISIFRAGDPLQDMAEKFNNMLQLTDEMTLAGGEIFFGSDSSPEARTAVYKKDILVNKLERKIRKRVVAHLSLQSSTGDLPFCLLLMSLVKDVERIGDYATNLAEISEHHPDSLPEGKITKELGEIRKETEEILTVTSDIFKNSDRERAIDIIMDAKNIQKRCDTLIVSIAGSDYSARQATVIALGARFYKRIVGHTHNIMSAVVMPLHKLDYYDEKELTR